MKIHGRIDWKPRLGVWRVVCYVGTRDVSKGDHATRQEAVKALQSIVAKHEQDRTK